MKLLSFAIVGLLAPFSVFSAPIDDREVNTALAEHLQLRQFEPLSYADFSGIDWDYAFKPDICNTTQLEILLETVRNVWDTFAAAPLDGKVSNDEDNAAWRHFFGGRVINRVAQPKYGWYSFDTWGTERQRGYMEKIRATYRNIKNSQQVAYSWPRTGGSDGQRVAFLCEKGQRSSSSSRFHCRRNRQLQAYTTPSSQQQGLPWTISFCNRFFDDYKAIQDVIDAGYTTKEKALMSREHMLYHEYMHVHIMGHLNRIIDVVDTLE